MWLALIITKKERVENEEKIIKMALAHDITESRTGDVDYISRLFTDLKEDMAAQDMLEETSLEDEFISLIKEHEERKIKLREQVFSKLFTKTAQKFFRQIYAADVHDWHFKSRRNRFNQGDFKISK